MTYPDLIDRLEKAEGGDQDLSLAVNLALEGGEAVTYTANYIMEPRWAIRRQSANHVGGFAKEPNYPVTESLDAALALAERVLPGWLWDVTTITTAIGGIRKPLAVVMDPDGDNDDIRTYGSAATPALALCIAILKARASSEGEGEK